MNQIWEELGPKIKELLELGKTGVVASILAACQRLGTYRLEVFIYELLVPVSLFENGFSINMFDLSVVNCRVLKLFLRH
jgi:hypothetical protein